MSNPSPTAAFPFVALLGCVLVVLKALALIDLPWLWVLCPFWLGPAIAAVVLAGVGLVVAAGWLFVNLVARFSERKPKSK